MDILRILEGLSPEVLAYTMQSEECNTVDELVDKLCKCYNEDELEEIAEDLMLNYETSK